ncbi:MAG: hypothetical protein J6E44_02070 [Lachnospiraceae bacterium]|nr:hypothetical protein [Lachnospiraceae bacterium]
MIQTIRKKLKSEDGASLMLALLFFVICAMVASVILAAATAAAGRISKLEETNQDRLALESAAGVIKNELVGVKYISTQNYNDEGPTGTPEPAWQRLNKTNNRYEEVEVNFSGIIEKMLSKTKKEYTISATNMPSVIMAPSMVDTDEDKYSIIIKLTIAEGNKPLEMVLTLPADYQEHDEVINGQKSHIEEITWHTCVAVLNDGEYK